MNFLRNTRNISTPAFCALLCLGVVAVRMGATKGGGNGGGTAQAQFVLWDGHALIDPTGSIPPFTLLYHSSTAITNAASVAASALDDSGAVEELANDLYNELQHEDGDAIYIALRLPFSTPQNTALNLAAYLMRWTQFETEVEAVWWFSSKPLSAISVLLPVTDSEGVTYRLTETTNEWPQVTLVDGVECYRTVYEIPPELQGVTLIPPADPIFGGMGRQFILPEDGVVFVHGNGLMSAGITDVKTITTPAGNVFKIFNKGGFAVRFELNGVELKDREVIICE